MASVSWHRGMVLGAALDGEHCCLTSTGVRQYQFRLGGARTAMGLPVRQNNETVRDHPTLRLSSTGGRHRG